MKMVVLLTNGTVNARQVEVCTDMEGISRVWVDYGNMCEYEISKSIDFFHVKTEDIISISIVD